MYVCKNQKFNNNIYSTTTFSFGRSTWLPLLRPIPFDLLTWILLSVSYLLPADLLLAAVAAVAMPRSSLSSL